MKKLLLALPATALLAACATNQPVTRSMGPMDSFSCEANSALTAQYSADGDVANLVITMPSLNMKNVPITMQNAVSASGSRYVNDTNPNTSYEWHTKGDMGILTVNAADGNAYTVNCEK